LDGCHRHERQKSAGADHAEHVAKVGAGTHADVFEDVYENLATLDDTCLQYHEVSLQENDCRSRLRDIDRGIDGGAHVGYIADLQGSIKRRSALIYLGKSFNYSLLRNRIHLQEIGNPLDTDWNAFKQSDLLTTTSVLHAVFIAPAFQPTEEQRPYFDYLLLKKPA
jgi:hypothetical protein